jgi:rod shape determining protein RodA
MFCVGVVTLIFSHMFINIAMTIGTMPITGLPLPFISYGRTFMLTMMVALGLVQSVSIHGRESETRF